MEEALTAFLLADVNVHARLGGRIMWGLSEQGLSTRPFAVLQHVGSTPTYTMASVVNYESARIQIDVYSDTYSTARLAARAVEACLSGLRNEEFLGIFCQGNQDFTDQDDSDQTPLYRVSSDYIVHYQPLLTS